MVQNTCKYYHKLIISCKDNIVCHYNILVYCSLLYIIYKVYQIEKSAAMSLSSLSMGLERKVKCYNEYFIERYMFHTEEYRHKRKTYNIGVCVKTYYYGRLEEVAEFKYHSKKNKVFLFKCYWYNTTDRGIRVDPHYGLIDFNSKARLRNVNDVFVFAKQCQQVYYI